MARNTKLVTITAEGRDKGKKFMLHEMPADQGERWANRAILAIANAGGKLPEGVLESGMAGFELTWRNALVVGLLAFKGLSYREIEPLLDEMKPLIAYIPPQPGAPEQPIFPGEPSQIEEVATWYTLRYALLELHLNFSLADVISTTGTTPEVPPVS